MSIYATWLDLEHPDQTKASLEAAGIDYGVIGDDTEQRGLGSPYVYQGSHVRPGVGDPRGGSLEVGSIPNHCHPDAVFDGKTDDTRFRVDFLRVGIIEDPATYGYEHDRGTAAVLLDRRQVTALRDTLTAWLDAEVRW